MKKSQTIAPSKADIDSAVKTSQAKKPPAKEKSLLGEELPTKTIGRPEGSRGKEAKLWREQAKQLHGDPADKILLFCNENPVELAKSLGAAGEEVPAMALRIKEAQVKAWGNMVRYFHSAMPVEIQQENRHMIVYGNLPVFDLQEGEEDDEDDGKTITVQPSSEEEINGGKG